MAPVSRLAFGGPVRGADKSVGSICGRRRRPGDAPRDASGRAPPTRSSGSCRSTSWSSTSRAPGSSSSPSGWRSACPSAGSRTSWRASSRRPTPSTDIGVEDAVPVGDFGASPFDGYAGGYSSSTAISYDRVPKGEIELRRSSDVEAVDGHRLGHLAALELDERWTITQVVLEHGHLWGTRDVTVPIARGRGARDRPRAAHDRQARALGAAVDEALDRRHLRARLGRAPRDASGASTRRARPRARGSRGSRRTSRARSATCRPRRSRARPRSPPSRAGRSPGCCPCPPAGASRPRRPAGRSSARRRCRRRRSPRGRRDSPRAAPGRR